MYCAFIRRASLLPMTERLAEARRRLIALYAAATWLPVNPDGGDVEAPRVEALANPPEFGDRDFYWEVFDPYELTEPVGGSLSDDLYDVYRDLQRGLVLWDAWHRVEALWQWRFHFDAHWGDHVVDALRALHRACNPMR